MFHFACTVKCDCVQRLIKINFSLLKHNFHFQQSESENESVKSEPHSFVNHYADVNDTLRASWKRQRPVRQYSSHTESEPESGVLSLNGGHVVLNNMARSRAPLPGFSSFV